MSCFKCELLVVLQVRWKGKDQLSDYVSIRHRDCSVQRDWRSKPDKQQSPMVDLRFCRTDFDTV